MLISLEFDGATKSVEKTMLATTETSPAPLQLGGSLYPMGFSGPVLLKKDKPISHGYLQLTGIHDVDSVLPLFFHECNFFHGSAVSS